MRSGESSRRTCAHCLRLPLLSLNQTEFLMLIYLLQKLRQFSHFRLGSPKEEEGIIWPLVSIHCGLQEVARGA